MKEVNVTLGLMVGIVNEYSLLDHNILVKMADISQIKNQRTLNCLELHVTLNI